MADALGSVVATGDPAIGGCLKSRHVRVLRRIPARSTCTPVVRRGGPVVPWSLPSKNLSWLPPHDDDHHDHEQPHHHQHHHHNHRHRNRSPCKRVLPVAFGRRQELRWRHWPPRSPTIATQIFSNRLTTKYLPTPKESFPSPSSPSTAAPIAVAATATDEGDSEDVERRTTPSVTGEGVGGGRGRCQRWREMMGGVKPVTAQWVRWARNAI